MKENDNAPQLDFPAEPRKWDVPIAGRASTVTLTISFAGYQNAISSQMPIATPCPTHGEFISKFLDSPVKIYDAGTGRLLYDTTVMELALQRIRAAGLGVKAAQAAEAGEAAQES